MDLSNPNHQLFKALKGYILHCTSPKSYRLICEDGYLRANHGNFPFSWDQTKGSCVYKMGGIALLDFGLPEDKIFFVTDQENFHYPWVDILLRHEPLSVIIKIHRRKIYGQILTWEKIREKTGTCLLIPYVEVCSLDPIPTSAFEGIVIVNSFAEFVDLSADYLSREFLDRLVDRCELSKGNDCLGERFI